MNDVSDEWKDWEMKSGQELIERTLVIATASFLVMALTGSIALAIQVDDVRQETRQVDSGSHAAAKRVADWIRSTEFTAGGAHVWPAVADDRSKVDPTLYSGAAGVVLFFLELHHATGDEQYLADARKGADFLLTQLDQELPTGLYTGVAGIGFALTETFKSTAEEKYREGALQTIQLLKDRAKPAGTGVEWNETTDIISGSAGIGLFLLYAAREFQDESCRELAASAGRRLSELGKPDLGGVKCAMDPEFDRLMPNFSHGTAGVAYFLASLYLETRESRFLEPALAGAKYLIGVANRENGGFLVFHHEPAEGPFYYLGWCHGPEGTSRLFHRLFQATGDKTWRELTGQCGESILRSGIPGERLPGFWNNVGQCCGNAGIADFCLQMHGATGNDRYRELAQQFTDDILARATTDDQGTRWVHSEHRVRPDLLLAQTGFMQGAAGIGMWLLHWEGFLNGRPRRIVFPDSPFAN